MIEWNIYLSESESSRDGLTHEKLINTLTMTFSRETLFITMETLLSLMSKYRKFLNSLIIQTQTKVMMMQISD